MISRKIGKLEMAVMKGKSWKLFRMEIIREGEEELDRKC